MDQRTNIEKKVEKTLALLDTETRLPADPYFFTRLEARLKTEASRQLHKNRLRARWQPVLLTALAGLNIFTALIWVPRHTALREKNRTMAIIAEDYALKETSADWLIQSAGDE